MVIVAISVCVKCFVVATMFATLNAFLQQVQRVPNAIRQIDMAGHSNDGPEKGSRLRATIEFFFEIFAQQSAGSLGIA